MVPEVALRWLVSIFFMLCLPGQVAAFFLQWPTVEELTQKLQNTPPDTNRVALLLRLSEHYVNQPGEETSDLDSALMLTLEAEQISEHFHFQVGLGKSYIKFSEIYREKGEKEI